jgi:hypothetical protein
VDELPSAAALVGAGGAGALILKVLWERFLHRAEKNERRVEEEHEARTSRSESRLEGLQVGIGEIKSQLVVLIDHDAFARAESRRLEERLNGVASNHSGRLAQLEASVVRLETLAQLPSRTP